MLTRLDNETTDIFDIKTTFGTLIKSLLNYRVKSHLLSSLFVHFD